MNVLAFDTCFSFCSAGVAAGPEGGARIVRIESTDMDTGHAEALMPMVERVMLAAGLAFGDLDRIVVTEGPGTFTGIRTGIAAARGLALATGAGIVTVSSLWAIAAGQLDGLRSGEGDFDVVLAVADARKAQVYAQVVDRSGRELTAPQLLSGEDALALCEGSRAVVVGSGAALVWEAARASGREIALLPDRGGARLRHVPDMKVMLDIAGSRSTVERPSPLYLRPPDAKPQTAKSLPWSQP